jgi:hypothetical protein
MDESTSDQIRQQLDPKPLPRESLPSGGEDLTSASARPRLTVPSLADEWRRHNRATWCHKGSAQLGLTSGGHEGSAGMTVDCALYIEGMTSKVTPRPAGQSGHGSDATLRRRRTGSAEGRPEAGFAAEYEVICPDCGDHADMDYSEVEPRLQLLRGPYPLAAGLAAYHQHLGVPWPDRPDLVLLSTRLSDE